jgi:hypothetical protein
MITSALLRTETERWREEPRLSSSGVFIGGFLWQAWHDTRSQRAGSSLALGTAFSRLSTTQVFLLLSPILGIFV